MFQHKIMKEVLPVLNKVIFVKLKLNILFQMNDDHSIANTTLKPSTKQRALMENKILTKQISTKQNSAKQTALMEDRISSWNMNGSVPILTFTGRGEYLSQIAHELYGQILCP